MIKKEEYNQLKEIRKNLEKAIKYEDNVSVAVKVYDAYEGFGLSEREQTYDVEINYYINGEYEEGWTNYTYYGRHEDDEEAKKEAIKRAKTVLRSVKNWFEYSDVEVESKVEVYHV